MNEKIETLSPPSAISVYSGEAAAELPGASGLQIAMHADDVPAFGQAIDA
ncbi:MAG: hypothetical protein K2X43_25410 [Hyphomonadaceae bacterium]|nr:hypothetical protein [Hyphomonadaceae bacterium]